MRIAVAARRDAERRQHRFDIGDALGGGGFADLGHQNDGRQNHLARAEIAANVGRHHRATGEEDGGEQKGDFFHRVFPGWAEKVSNPPASGFGADYTTRRRKCARAAKRGRIPRIRLPCARLFLFPALDSFIFLAPALSLSFAAALFLSRAASPFSAPPLPFSRALLFPFPAKAGIQIGSAEYGGIETLPAFAETGDSNWIPAFAGKEFDNIAGRTMTDSFSSAYDSPRDFSPSRWPWIVGALIISVIIGAVALFFYGGEWLAVSLGYANIEKNDIKWLVPKTEFARDYFIAIASFIGIGLAFWRNSALDRQSEAALEQAKIGNQQAQHDQDRIAGERFSNAAKLLAQKDAENKPAIDARIGGIYSLQTLANNRIAEYGAQVVKTLISYIKQNAQLTAQPPLKENEMPKEARENETPQEAHALGEDVKTAFNVLEQLLSAREENSAEWDKLPFGIKLSHQNLSFSGQDFSRLDLSVGQVDGLHRYIWSLVKLQGANLARVQLQGVDLSGAQLQDADLSWAKLQGADLSEAKLQGANLPWVKLQGANLSGAELQGANLPWVKLQGANLSGAELQGADLSWVKLQGANLSGAELQGVDLSGAELQGADLSEAKLNDATTLPSNLSGKIWHSGQLELSKIASPSPDAEWNLTLFLLSGYALAGVLRNFALPYGIARAKNESVMRAKKLRIAVRKLLDEKQLPEDFPQDERNWLGGIESDGSHPDDLKRLG